MRQPRQRRACRSTTCSASRADGSAAGSSRGRAGIRARTRRRRRRAERARGGACAIRRGEAPPAPARSSDARATRSTCRRSRECGRGGVGGRHGGGKRGGGGAAVPGTPHSLSRGWCVGGGRGRRGKRLVRCLVVVSTAATAAPRGALGITAFLTNNAVNGETPLFIKTRGETPTPGGGRTGAEDSPPLPTCRPMHQRPSYGPLGGHGATPGDEPCDAPLSRGGPRAYAPLRACSRRRAHNRQRDRRGLAESRRYDKSPALTRSCRGRRPGGIRAAAVAGEAIFSTLVACFCDHALGSRLHRRDSMHTAWRPLHPPSPLGVVFVVAVVVLLAAGCALRAWRNRASRCRCRGRPGTLAVSGSSVARHLVEIGMFTRPIVRTPQGHDLCRRVDRLRQRRKISKGAVVKTRVRVRRLALSAVIVMSACTRETESPALVRGELVDLSHSYDAQTIYWPTAEASGCARMRMG